MHILFGGSFDPVHRGHAETALAVQARLPGSCLHWLPAARSPLKSAVRASGNHRAGMLRALLKAHPDACWQLDCSELERPPPSYAIDTLRRWRDRLGPAASLAFLMGRDSLAGLDRWRDWRQLTDMAHLIVATRQGSDAPLPDAVASWLKIRQISAPELLQSRPFGSVLLLSTPPWPVSSTAIRHALAQGGAVADWLDPAVWGYIQEHGLYRPLETSASP